MNELISGSERFIGFQLPHKILYEVQVVWGSDNFLNYYDLSLKFARLNLLPSNLPELISGIKPNYFSKA